MAVEVGQPAPDFTLTAHTGESTSLSQFKGKQNVVLAFYVLCFTGVWAMELASIRHNYSRFQAQNAQVLGINIDSRFAQNQFAMPLGGLPFPLLSDFHPKGKVAQQFGVYDENSGRSVRSIFIVDKEGIVRWEKVYETATVPDLEEVLAELAKLPK